jgi:hypothetical protein
MRFLIVPNYPHPYDQRMVSGLAAALHNLGHEAYALPAPLADIELVRMCNTVGADVVMQINRVRPLDPPLPKTVRHITWFQDVFPDTEDNTFNGLHASDIVYTLGDAKVLGLKNDLPCQVGCLVTGVDETILNFREHKSFKKVGYIDFSLCGFIPPLFVCTPSFKSDLLWYWDDLLARIPLIGGLGIFQLLRRILFRRHVPIDYVPYAVLTALEDIVRGLYKPLRGDLDIHSLSEAMRSYASLIVKPKPSNTPRQKPRNRNTRLGILLRPYNQNSRGRQAVDRSTLRRLASLATRVRENKDAIEQAISYFAQTYPRQLDRIALVQRALNVSKSVELYGPGWDTHEQFKPYHKGVLQAQGELLTVYQRSRINLANNTHGLGLHSRTLECMAVNGFIFTHASPHDDKPGGMFTSFEPGVHYGMFTPENFEEQARSWLDDEKRRIEAGRNAAAVIRQKHLWRHRAQQILNDLQQ